MHGGVEVLPIHVGIGASQRGQILFGLAGGILGFEIHH
ncbi:MAG: hypothetical protein BWZ07_01861 [Alphaproteobacteria bacterium ADurb.BinA280]|nr:MAG: hypothetical protein BWZ07_01861 [Alphaproteobacteria bacterium ADurb.BinA280]